MINISEECYNRFDIACRDNLTGLSFRGPWTISLQRASLCVISVPLWSGKQTSCPPTVFPLYRLIHFKTFFCELMLSIPGHPTQPSKMLEGAFAQWSARTVQAGVNTELSRFQIFGSFQIICEYLDSLPWTQLVTTSTEGFISFSVISE